MDDKNKKATRKEAYGTVLRMVLQWRHLKYLVLPYVLVIPSFWLIEDDMLGLAFVVIVTGTGSILQRLHFSRMWDELLLDRYEWVAPERSTWDRIRNPGKAVPADDLERLLLLRFAWEPQTTRTITNEWSDEEKANIFHSLSNPIFGQNDREEK